MKSSEVSSTTPYPAPICNTCWTSPCRCPLPFVRVCHCVCQCHRCPCFPQPAAYPTTFPAQPIIYTFPLTNVTAPKPSGGTYSVAC